MSNPLSMPQIIAANGLDFGYHSLGQGPLVLFLHGFPDTAKAWDHALAPIGAAGYRAVAVYMRGYAPSGIPASDPTIADLAEDVIGLINAFGGSPAVVVGHDWGAAAAYGAAALAPEAIKKLITVALPHPAGFRPGIADAWRARHFISFKRKSAPRKFVANDFAGLRAIYRRWSPQWHFTEVDLADIKRCLANPDSLDAIFGYYRALPRRLPELLQRKVDVPTVAFAGRTDGAVSLDAFGDAAGRFTAGYEVIELPGGHFLHREDPDLFVGRLGDVLAV